MEAWESVDIVAFGAHPDDVEIGCAGILHRHVQMGKRVLICDLTKAELSSNGNVELRQQEAAHAAEIIGAKRINLGMADRGIVEDTDSIRKVVAVLRRYQPKLVLAPYWEDRHPDHMACYHLVYQAIFSATIRKFVVDDLPPHRVKQYFAYFINQITTPSCLMDISQQWETKRAALLAYGSQFSAQPGTVSTPLNAGYLASLEGRERYFGSQLGVQYAEGLVSKNPLQLTQLV
nr:bacillithiol biosynthesis deacetylase BshB1 [Rubeoparvulum massiliense]